MAKILVVEDVAAVLLSIRIILTAHAHDISVAADGAQGHPATPHQNAA